ncbi:MAG: GatB/YqeY domain-containing protein [Sphingobacteriaceae bacterium]
MSLQIQIDQDIKAAMLAKNEARLRGLRAIKAALLLAKTEKGAAESPSADAEIKVLQKLVKQRKESAAIYQAQNRTDLYQIEAEEIEVIEAYLPQQLDAESIKAHIKQLIAEHGAQGVKDMGKIMGLASKALAGQADGKTISEIVKELLS